MSRYRTVNPATGELIEEFPTATDEQIEQALERADRAYRHWRWSALDKRADVLRRLAELHRQRADELAEILTLQVPRRQIRHRRVRLPLLVRQGTAAGIRLDHPLPGPAGRARLPRARGRALRPGPGHPAEHRGHRCDLRRGDRAVAGHRGRGRNADGAVSGHRAGAAV